MSDDESPSTHLLLIFASFYILYNRKHSLKETLHLCQQSMAEFYRKLNSHSRSLKLLNGALSTVRCLKNRIYECEYLMQKGNLLLSMLKFRDARRSFLKASLSKSPVEEDLEKAREKLKLVTDVCKGWKVLQNKFQVDVRELKIIMMNIDKGKKKEGLKDCIETEEQDEDKVQEDNRPWLERLNLKESPPEEVKQVLSVLDKMGDILCDLNSFDSGVKCYRIILKLAQETSQSSALIAVVLVSIGQTYLDDKKYKEAHDYFGQELEIRKKMHPRNFWEETRTSLKILEVMINSKSNTSEEIIKTYESTLLCYESDDRCKRKILEDFLAYLDAEMILDKASEVEQQLKDLKRKEGGRNVKKKCIEDEDLEEFDSTPASLDPFSLSGASSLSTDESTSEDEEKPPATFLSTDQTSSTTTTSRRRRQPRNNKKIKTNEVGETPLHRACIEGDVKKVKKLIEAGHPVNPRDHCGWLPIHEASNHDFPDIVEVLIDSGAHIDDPGGEKCGGTTPSHDACSNGNFAVIQLLIRKGADVCKFDSEGNTPLDCLRSWRQRVGELDSIDKDKYQAIVQSLEQRMKEKGFDVEFERKRNIVPAIGLNDSSVNNRLKKRKFISRKTAVYGDSEDEVNDSDKETVVPQAGKQRKKKRRDDTLEVDFDDAGAAREQYETVIRNLRRNPSFDNQSSDEEISEKGSSASALINASERLDVDEWLVDDLQDKKLKKKNTSSSHHHDLYESRHLPVMRHRVVNRDDDDELSNRRNAKKSDKRNEGTSRVVIEEEETNIPVQRQVLQAMDIPFEPELDSVIRPVLVQSLVPSNSLMSQVSDSSTGTGVRSNHEDKKSKILIKVKVESRTFLIKVPNEETPISWLTQETVNRFYQMEKKRPDGIHLETDDGAILFPEDLVTDVVTGGEVIAKIHSFKTLSLEEEYVESCKIKRVDARGDIRHFIKNMSSTSIMNLSHCRNIPSPHDAIFLETLSKCDKDLVVSVDLSFVSSEVTKVILPVLQNFQRLQELTIQGVTGFSLHHLLDTLTDLKLQSVTQLDVSYNCFIGEGKMDVSVVAYSLTRLLESLSKLKSLFLIATDITMACFEGNQEGSPLVRAVVQHSFLKDIVVDEEVTESMNAILGGRLKSQKWKSIQKVQNIVPVSYPESSS